MNDELNHREEELLQDIVTGDMDIQAKQVREAADKSPSFRRALDEHLRMRRHLDGGAQVLAEARAEQIQTDRQLVEGNLERALGRPNSRFGPHWRWMFLAAAALVALIPASRYWTAEPDRVSPVDGTLNPGSTEILHPRGQVEEFLPVEINYNALGPHRRVVLRLEGPDGALLAEIERFADETWNSWEPTTEALDGLRSVTVVVEVYDLSDGLRDVLQSSASLSH